jgi:hypothetical protein
MPKSPALDFLDLKGCQPPPCSPLYIMIVVLFFFDGEGNMRVGRVLAKVANQ